MIIDKFDEICKQKNGQDLLNDLPFESVLPILQNDDLNVRAEIDIASIVIAYLTHRNKLPLLDEEDPSKKWDNLTPEEKKNREEIKKKEEEDKKTQ